MRGGPATPAIGPATPRGEVPPLPTESLVALVPVRLSTPEGYVTIEPGGIFRPADANSARTLIREGAARGLRPPVIEKLLVRYRATCRLLDEIAPSAGVMQPGSAAYKEAYAVFNALGEALDRADEAAFDKAAAEFRRLMEPWRIQA